MFNNDYWDKKTWRVLRKDIRSNASAYLLGLGFILVAVSISSAFLSGNYYEIKRNPIFYVITTPCAKLTSELACLGELTRYFNLLACSLLLIFLTLIFYIFYIGKAETSLLVVIFLGLAFTAISVPLFWGSRLHKLWTDKA